MLPGTDFEVTEKGTLSFNDYIIAPEPKVYTIEDVGVFYEKNNSSNEPLYYVYEGVSTEDDLPLFLDNNIRYDLTVLLPKQIGKEYNKTIGHFHPKKDNNGDTFSEYSEVLMGEALFLLQKNNMSGEVEEIIAVEAKKGDKVYIPPNYGHIIINSSEEFLVVASLVARNFTPSDENFKCKHGAAYYYVEGENKKGDWIKNTNYKSSVGLKIKGAPSLEHPIELDPETSLYNSFITSPELFDFLK